MTAPSFLLKSLEQALSYDSTAFMIYTGPPQSSRRTDIELLKIDEFKEGCSKNNIELSSVVVHAPYIINLASSNTEKHDISVNILLNEVGRCEKIGSKYLVVHPGSNENTCEGINQIAKAINACNKLSNKVVICLETMSGKGNEIGINFEQLNQIIQKIECKESVGVCLDTCHISDAGYNVSNIESILSEFDKLIGLYYLKVIHLNDSLNQQGSKKDRHANIGKGTIGLNTLAQYVHNEKLLNVIKILETPYVDGKAIYKEEINLLLNHNEV